jgi:RloB-like protein
MARRRLPRSYARSVGNREPYAYVAIVCEGRKTEPYYFEGLRAAYRLSNANVQITPAARGTDPISVVQYAEELLQREGYDRVYCVFDRNGHGNYEQALERIRASVAGTQGRLIGIPSWPCFEVWLLLHHRYSSAPFMKAGRRSACDRVIAQLVGYLPRYEKGQRNIFDVLGARLPDAIRNATRLERDNLRTEAENPATSVHRLVNYLCALKAP